MGCPLPLRQVRERFPLVFDLLPDRLALSLPVVSDLDAVLLLEEILSHSLAQTSVWARRERGYARVARVSSISLIAIPQASMPGD